MSRTATLRLSLLVAMGLVPIACGGTARSRGNSAGNAGSSGSQNGHSGGSQAGTFAAGVGGGASSTGGVTSTAGSTAEAGSMTGGTVGQGGSSCQTPVVDPVSGLACEGVHQHRPTAVDCAGGPQEGGEGGGGGEQLPRATAKPCYVDAECAEFQWGYCASAAVGLEGCRSGCYTDSDCGAGSICVCGSSLSPTGGECHSARCTTDADCPDSICASFVIPCRLPGFACVTANDACASDADCASGLRCGWSEETQARACYKFPVCGRPFLVAQAPRVPPVTSRYDWSDAIAPRVEHLSFAERAAQAAHWTKLGQLEHASIAAFARFSLQLLALGAPPQLVDACTAALADETAHAKLCFGIASAYAGRPIGPGPLDVSNSLEPTSLADIVDLVILEGCIGETGAALDALESAEIASDPVIRAAYSRIAADEQRHAELAFRFVQWALQHGGEAVAAQVQVAMTALPRSRACDEVVRPCLSTLLKSAMADGEPQSCILPYSRATPRALC